MIFVIFYLIYISNSSKGFANPLEKKYLRIYTKYFYYSLLIFFTLGNNIIIIYMGIFSKMNGENGKNFNEKLIPFKRESVIDEMASRIKTTFCSVYSYFSNTECYSESVVCENCDRYPYHRDYLSGQHFCSEPAMEWMSNPNNHLDGKKYRIRFNYEDYNIVIKLNIYGDVCHEHLVVLISKCITLILINKILICELEINLVLIPLKRMYPSDFKNSDSSQLGVNEVNGGFTTWRGNEWGKIYVWRREELDKVLVHEMIHALHLDFHNYDTEIDDFFKNNFFIEKQGSFLFFEAYTELWAEFLNIIFDYSFEMCIRKKKGEDLNYLYDKLANELNFSLVQVSKLLLWYGFDRFTDCGFYCKDKCKNVETRMTEGTSIFSYFIVRSIYFFCLPQFLTLCNRTRLENKTAMFDGDDKKRHLSYLDLIQKNIDEYGENIDKIMNIIKSNTKRFDGELLNSMRMSSQTHHLE